MVLARCPGHNKLSGLSVYISKLVGFVSLLVVSEREEDVVANVPIRPLKTSSGMEPIQPLHGRET